MIQAHEHKYLDSACFEFDLSEDQRQHFQLQNHYKYLQKKIWKNFLLNFNSVFLSRKIVSKIFNPTIFGPINRHGQTGAHGVLTRILQTFIASHRSRICLFQMGRLWYFAIFKAILFSFYAWLKVRILRCNASNLQCFQLSAHAWIPLILDWIDTH